MSRVKGRAPIKFRKKPVVVFYPCKPDIFAATYEEATERPLRVETYRTVEGESTKHHEYRWRVVHTSNGEIMSSGEGYMAANPGDWIIRGVQGEFYPCKPDIFAATYEEATERPLRVETYRTVEGESTKHHEYRWRLVHTSNGEVMASGEGYTAQSDRDHAVAVLFPGVEIVEVEG